MTTLEASDPAPAAAARWAGLAVVGLVVLATLYAAFTLYLAGQPLLGVLMLVLAGAVAAIFSRPAFYATRFIFPGLVAVAVFIAFPVAYTIGLGFTNYSSFNLLTFERATEVILSRGTVDPETEQPFALIPDGDGLRLALPEAGLISEPLALDGTETEIVLAPGTPAAEPLAMRDVVARRAALQALTLTGPDGLRLQSSGLRRFAAITPEYTPRPDGTLLGAGGDVLTPNHEIGFYETETGEAVAPGWRVFVGLENFERIFASEGIRGPMVSIFLWTVAFAFLSMAGCFAVGLTLAVILQWPHLAGRGIYRILLILPYAVPAFISILVFRGLFNQNFGEVNLILEALFGLRPEWFTDGGLARTMIVIVNIWLGYPYMMLLAMGFLQNVPADHKKAAALEGAGAMRVFFTITLPQIVPPFLPLLIATFAFNFNNLVLILLLTRGLPDIPGTVIPAGQTDILGSFTYRIAFTDSAQQFGLAGAITFLIFVVVAALAYANFVAMRRAADRRFKGT
ncbi:maltose ABC transporter permease MalF [Jannaschia aquimarina]|uniref:Maltose/maltodextrin transport system permease protein n=1 Tax=Jannaschia aquimarina TaxID=935700 RepID=A0A0D1CHU8_9RHOB|nr:maltose ABC transporter permease MalF [Jannaschia aquimarina]KIT14257.1 Maltose transport system permease protein MalF [Jannaschia aquimarina]SNS49380.1 maltooligosaccharide ABC transporter membrane protein [Jannaschia aquimarina]